MTDLCEAIVRPATRYEPEERCENEAEPGSEFCYGHDPDGAAADHAEALGEARREERGEW